MFTHNVVFVVASVAVWMTLAAWNVSVFVTWSQIRNLAGIWEIPRGSNFQWLDRKINSIGALTWSDRVTSHALRHSQVLTRWSILISFYRLISLHFIIVPIFHRLFCITFIITYRLCIDDQIEVRRNWILIYIFVPTTSRNKYDNMRIEIRLS